jgi:O-acetyl-ADP-ribose deacetylase (regulator of RNase III)
MIEGQGSTQGTIGGLGRRLAAPFQNRQKKYNSKRWNKAFEETKAATGENRMRIQVCPRGCSYQLGRRDIVTRSRLSGRADIEIRYNFETLSCGKCGTPYQRECVRCGFPIFAPLADRCEWCGLPHPWAVERRAVSTRVQPREWRADESIKHSSEESTKPSAERLASYGDDRKFYVIEGDITTFEIDALISNDDEDGRMWTLVASSIKAAAGNDVEYESISHGPYRLGSAWLTHGGNLPTSRGIIHVAAMDRNGKSKGLETIRKCLWAALELAVKKEIESVAFAAMGTAPRVIEKETGTITSSAAGSPPGLIKLDDWLKDIAPLVGKFLRETSVKLTVLLVLYGQDDFPARVEMLKKEIHP